MTDTDMQDALNPRMAGSTEGMTLQVLAQIRDSLTGQNRDIRTLTEHVSEVRERVIRLEERDKRLEDLEAAVKRNGDNIESLMTDKSRREGVGVAFKGIKEWAPFVAMISSVLAAAWLYGRSAGIVPAPPVAAVRLEASGNPRNQNIEGTVGGKPQ